MVKKQSSSGTQLALRIVLFGALAVVLVLAVIDYTAKSAAVATSEAWRKAFNEAEQQERHLTVKELEKLASGSPAKSPAEAEPGQNATLYTWNQILGGDYEIKVIYDPLDEPIVAKIEVDWE